MKRRKWKTTLKILFKTVTNYNCIPCHGMGQVCCFSERITSLHIAAVCGAVYAVWTCCLHFSQPTSVLHSQTKVIMLASLDSLPPLNQKMLLSTICSACNMGTVLIGWVLNKSYSKKEKNPQTIPHCLSS